MNAKSFRLQPLAFALMYALPSVVLAQTSISSSTLSTTDNAMELELIIVTVRKLEENVQDVQIIFFTAL
ncbi:hypothetical protein [Lonepinella sp. BR2271]|uniref:hypothetical protein n=1 Tax=Lonepinella sp. BR2271 TaxID=3434550 RepID=UPI003F6DB4CE